MPLQIILLAHDALTLSRPVRRETLTNILDRVHAVNKEGNAPDGEAGQRTPTLGQFELQTLVQDQQVMESHVTMSMHEENEKI